MVDRESRDDLLFELRFRLGDDESLRFATCGPWVVASDLPEDSLEVLLERTLRVRAAEVQQRLFEQPVTEPVAIYLFSADSYERRHRELFGRPPGTPFGYWSATHRRVVVNGSTGGGTLLHELVHVMVEDDLPHAPPWFDEGLSALHEATTLDDMGRVRGISNWRQLQLSRLLTQRASGLLEELVSGRLESGAHDALARYLVFFLQERGVLADTCARFRRQRDVDVAALLCELLGHESLDEVEIDFREWVTG